MENTNEINKVKISEDMFGAKDLLNGEEVQGIITLVIILIIGWATTLASALWLKMIGWAVVGFVGLSALKIGVEIKRRIKSKMEEKDGRK